jgi:hypothetical protein
MHELSYSTLQQVGESLDSRRNYRAYSHNQQSCPQVLDSWEQVRRMKNYEEETGTIFYQVLFDKHEAAETLFGFPEDIDVFTVSPKGFLVQSNYMIQNTHTLEGIQ